MQKIILKTFFLKKILLKKGYKCKSEILLQNSIKLVQKSYFKNHVDLFKSSLVNIMPVVFIKRLKKKQKYITEFPFVLNRVKRLSIAMMFMYSSSKQNSEEKFRVKFAKELIVNAKGHNNDIVDKNLIHEQAFSLKKYANYRWFL